MEVVPPHGPQKYRYFPQLATVLCQTSARYFLRPEGLWVSLPFCSFIVFVFISALNEEVGLRGAMAPIRILLACPGMEDVLRWRSILKQDSDIEVIGEVDDPVAALVEAGNSQATVVIIDLPTNGTDPGLYSHLLGEYPNVKVIAVSKDGSQALTFENGIIRSKISDTSPQNLTLLFHRLVAEEDQVWRAPSEESKAD